MTIQNEGQLRDALRKGVNLFVGSGFSIYAKDGDGQQLPTGSQLLDELNAKFGKTHKDLARLSTTLNHSNRDEFHNYLTRRFTVCDVGTDLYYNINLVKAQYIFTTNIDNLINKIADKNPDCYLHDMKVSGETADPNAIRYAALHGNVIRPKEEYIFETAQIATVFSNAPVQWHCLGLAVEKFPTVFLGYSFNDASTIEALASERNTNPNCHKDKWILLRNADEETKEYFTALNFNIIEGGIDEFLADIPRLVGSKPASGRTNKHILNLFKGNMVPEKTQGMAVRSIIHFYRGMDPTWYDVLSGNIVPTSHVAPVLNSILDHSKHTIITGAPICGKSTVAMQAVAKASTYSQKLWFDDMTKEKAEYLLKFLDGQNVLIMIENFADDFDAFEILAQSHTIKLVGIARNLDLGAVSHRISADKYDTFNVTDVTDADFNAVYKALPKDSRNDKLVYNKETNKYRRDTIFEFVLNNIKGQSIEDRFKSLMDNAYEDQIEFLVLCAYMHYSRVPLTMEVAMSYFGDRYNTFKECFDELSGIKKELDDLLKELDGEDYTDSDYYYPRSSYLADIILKYAPKYLLKQVIEGIVARVPQMQIPNYKQFRRRAFDHRIISDAFSNWKEGNDFYNEVYRYDGNNAYVLQHQALYLSKHKQHHKAFAIIDRAKMQVGDSSFTIRNSHAIILFDANYESTDTNAMASLDESMRILSRCYNDDARKTFHAEVFAEQALKYYKIDQSDKVVGYLRQAKSWLEDVAKNTPWINEQQRIARVQKVLDKIDKEKNKK